MFLEPLFVLGRDPLDIPPLDEAEECLTGTLDGLLTPVGFFETEVVEGEFFGVDDEAVETGERDPLLAVGGFLVGRREIGFLGAGAGAAAAGCAFDSFGSSSVLISGVIPPFTP